MHVLLLIVHAMLAPPAVRHRLRVECAPRCCATPDATFESLNVRAATIEALAATGVERPNALQTRVIPEIHQRGDMIIGAQTGSGKTLTYLIPTMDAIKADEDAGAARARPRRPRAIVLVPTRELALQVHGVAKAMSHHVKLSVACVHGGVPENPQLKRLRDYPVDVLVATPGRLTKLMEAGGLYLGDVRHVVLDEVDTMFDAGFGPELDAVLKITTRDLAADVRASSGNLGTGSVQHLAVGATHPESARALYGKWLGEARSIMVEGSHALPPQLRQNFLTCNGPDAKMAALRDLLGPADEEGRPRLVRRLVLFCCSQASARFVDHTLVEEGFTTANYHGAIPANERASNFASFVNGEAHVLVTTDLAARGLDQLDVEHVVQFDFAKSAADYVHRCGRTARAGRSGTVTNLVTKHDMGLVRTIRDAQKRGKDLVSAGEEQQKTQRARAQTELKVSSSYKPGRPAAAAVPTAVFPDCRGIPSADRAEEGAAAAPAGPGKARRSGSPKGRGRGGIKLRRGRGAPVGGSRRRGS